MKGTIIVFFVLILILYAINLLYKKYGQNSDANTDRKNQKNGNESVVTDAEMIVIQRNAKNTYLKKFPINIVPKSGITISGSKQVNGDIILSSEFPQAEEIGSEVFIIGSDEKGYFGQLTETENNTSSLYLYEKDSKEFVQKDVIDIVDKTIIRIDKQIISFSIPTHDFIEEDALSTDFLSDEHNNAAGKKDTEKQNKNIKKKIDKKKTKKDQNSKNKDNKSDKNVSKSDDNKKHETLSANGDTLAGSIYRADNYAETQNSHYQSVSHENAISDEAVFSTESYKNLINSAEKNEEKLPDGFTYISFDSQNAYSSKPNRAGGRTHNFVTEESDDGKIVIRNKDK